MIHVARGAKVSLRPVAAEDLDQLSAWDDDPEHHGEHNFFGFARPGSLRRGFEQTGLLNEQDGTLVIVTTSGERAGVIQYRRFPFGPTAANSAYEFGITVAPEHRGKGYGAEAQSLLAAYLFAVYPIERVQAHTDVLNITEQRSLERAGFTREGVMRRAQFRNGIWNDMVLYSKLRGE